MEAVMTNLRYHTAFFFWIEENNKKSLSMSLVSSDSTWTPSEHMVPIHQPCQYSQYDRYHCPSCSFPFTSTAPPSEFQTFLTVHKICWTFTSRPYCLVFHFARHYSGCNQYKKSTPKLGTVVAFYLYCGYRKCYSRILQITWLKS
jgi:hypothetical protein